MNLCARRRNLVAHPNNSHRVRSSRNADLVAVAHHDQVAFLDDARFDQSQFCVITHQVAVVGGVFHVERENFAVERHLRYGGGLLRQRKDRNAAVQSTHPQSA